MTHVLIVYIQRGIWRKDIFNARSFIRRTFFPRTAWVSERDVGRLWKKIALEEGSQLGRCDPGDHGALISDHLTARESSEEISGIIKVGVRRPSHYQFLGAAWSRYKITGPQSLCALSCILSGPEKKYINRKEIDLTRACPRGEKKDSRERCYVSKAILSCYTQEDIIVFFNKNIVIFLALFVIGYLHW